MIVTDLLDLLNSLISKSFSARLGGHGFDTGFGVEFAIVFSHKKAPVLFERCSVCLITKFSHRLTIIASVVVKGHGGFTY